MGFGRNQVIAIGAFVLPMIVSTIALFTGSPPKADFAQWSSFTTTLVTAVVGIALGGSAVVKSAEHLSSRGKGGEGADE